MPINLLRLLRRSNPEPQHQRTERAINELWGSVSDDITAEIASSLRAGARTAAQARERFQIERAVVGYCAAHGVSVLGMRRVIDHMNEALDDEMSRKEIDHDTARQHER